MRTIPFSMIGERALKTGDLIDIKRMDESMFVACPTGTGVVVKASGWHAIGSNSIVGDVPKGCRRYYQILKVLINGRTFYNVHSHNVELLSSKA